MLNYLIETHLALAYWPKLQYITSTYHTRLAPYYITLDEFRPSTKKVYSSDVMHCQIGIFELKMMVKIGVIFMSFSNPTCHFRDTADFTVCTVSTLCKFSCISEMVSRI